MKNSKTFTANISKRNRVIIILLISLLVLSTGCQSGDDFDQTLKELIYSCLTLYVLSMFVSFFDSQVGSLLKKVAYLNGISILVIFGINLWAILIKFTNALDRISKFKLFGN